MLGGCILNKVLPNPAMQLITLRSLMSAFQHRLDRVRESLQDPGMQTALATVVACLEFLALLLWSAALTDLGLAWYVLNLVAIVALSVSPLWPSTIARRLFKGVNNHHVSVALTAFAVPVILVFLIFFFD